jgi:hypothetical protein
MTSDGGGASTTLSWENCKENAAPIARGRTVAHLEQPEMSGRDKAAQIQTFEQRIMDEAASDAPLTPWIDYIKWHENHFPSQVHAQFVLLERCCLAFQNDPRFLHDHRYIRLCCLYADKTREPTTTFQELYRAGIGRESAIFWNAYAYVAEKSNNFRLADRIFRHAVDTERAEPLPYLLQRKKHFEKRMAKHFLQSLDDAGISGEEEDDEQQLHQRSIFGSEAGGVGTSRAVRHGSSSSSTTTFIDRSIHGTTSRPGARENNPPNNNNTQPSFAIYGEDKSLDNDHSLFDDSRIVHSEREPEVQRWKENRGPRERWNERIHGPSIPIAQTSAFSVYVDEQCAAENARKEQERLRKEQEHRQNRRGMATTTGTTGGGDGQDKKRSKPAWKKNLLKDSFGKEQCFEEARMKAGCYRLVGPAVNRNLIAPETSQDDNDDSSMSMCDPNDDSVMYDETAVLDKRLLHMLQPRAATVVPTDSDHYDARMVIQNPPVPQPVTIPMNTSWNSNASGHLPTPTANMQFAMNQVSMMFSSPMVGDGMGEHAPTLLIHQCSPVVERENDLHRRYPDARSLPEAEAHVLNNLRQEDEADRSVLGCHRRAATDRQRRIIGTIRQDNPLAGLQEHDLPTNPGFSVYEDDNGESDNTTANTTIGAANHHAPPNHPGLSVYQDDVEPSSERFPFRTGAAGPGFTVFQDEPTSHNNNAPSSIFRRTTAADQEAAVDDDSVNSEDLRMFGGAASAGEATITSNAFDRLTLGARSTTTRGKKL